VLRPNGRLVFVGGPKDNRWVGPLGNLIRMRLGSTGGSRRVVPFIAKITRESLAAVGELLEAGTVTPAIDRTYPLDEGADAFRYVGEGHARAKVVVTSRMRFRLSRRSMRFRLSRRPGKARNLENACSRRYARAS